MPVLMRHMPNFMRDTLRIVAFKNVHCTQVGGCANGIPCGGCSSGWLAQAVSASAVAAVRSSLVMCENLS